MGEDGGCFETAESPPIQQRSSLPCCNRLELSHQKTRRENQIEACIKMANTRNPKRIAAKSKSALNKVVTREYTINIHKRIHGM